MSRLRQLIREIHRRSMWQVLLIYVGTSWAVLQVVDTVAGALQLPDWLEPVALVLLIVGLPIVLATAFVQEGGPGGAEDDHGSTAAPGHHPEPAKAGAVGNLFTWRNAITGGVLAFALWGVLVAGWMILGGGPAPAIPGPAPAVAALPSGERPAIAVLPFQNMSGLEEDRFFTEGMHDEILTRLAKIGSLHVISRTSVLGYESAASNIREIAEELGVGYIGEGSVRRAEDLVRITVQLIDARTDEHVWAETYDRELSPAAIFDIQSDVAQRIAEAVQAELTPEEAALVAARPTESLEAYDLYLRGLAAYAGRTTLADIDAAIDFFDRAIEIDPGFALAHAGAAKAWVNRMNYGGDAEEAVARAEEEARIAVSLEGAPPAYTVLGQLATRRWEWEEAERMHLRALSLLPNDAEAHHEYGEDLMGVGRFEEGNEQQRQAIALDPASAIFPNYLGMGLVILGEYDEGFRLLELARERGSPFAGAGNVVPLLLVAGRIEEAIELAGGREWDVAVAEAMRDGTGSTPAIVEGAPIGFRSAAMLALLGDGEATLDVAEAAVEQRAAVPGRILGKRVADLVGDDPRYLALLEEIGFPR